MSFTTLVKDVVELIFRRVQIWELAPLCRVSRQFKAWIQKDRRYGIYHSMIRSRFPLSEKFSQACILGELGLAKWIQLGLTGPIAPHAPYVLEGVCREGHLDVAKWLLEMYPTINLRSNRNAPIIQCLLHGHLSMALWLIRMSRTGRYGGGRIYLYPLVPQILHQLPEKRVSNLSVFIWFEKKYGPFEDLSTFFTKALHCGRTDLVDYLYQRSRYPITEADFYFVLWGGHIWTFLWLLEHYPEIDLDQINWGQIFPRICSWEILEKVELLLQIKPDLRQIPITKTSPAIAALLKAY